jgi:multidrug efflux pump subunit AcrA (membrane-fusion protein)
LAERSAIVVAPRVIVEKGQLTGVYVVDDQGLVSYRLVRTGRLHEQGLEIVSGLKGDETIITSGLEKALDGGMLGKEQKP